MSNRELAMNIISTLTDEQIEAFITLFASENIQAMMETEKIANDPNRKHYNSFNDIKIAACDYRNG